MHYIMKVVTVMRRSIRCLLFPVLIVGMLFLMSGCGISSADLQSIAHDIVLSVTPSEYDKVLSRIQYKVTPECMNLLLGRINEMSNGDEAKVIEYESVYDEETGIYVYYAYRSRKIGFNNDFILVMELNESRDKIERIEINQLYASGF